MKKNFKYALMSAIAFAGAVIFSACSSSDEIVDNPDYNPETNAVKTQFTISLPGDVGKTTRMASNIVQLDDDEASVTFRGMDNILLVPYTLGSGDVDVDATANAGVISLGNFSSFDYSKSNSKVFVDVNLNVGTTNFLVYGKAIDAAAGTAISTAADRFNYGTLNVNGLQADAVPTLSSVEFTPISITESNASVGTALIQALNDVADAAPSENLTSGDKPKFKDVTATQNVDIHHLFSLYSQLTTASSFSVQTIFDAIYTNLASLVTTSIQTSNPDAFKLATAIRSKIDEQRATAGAPTLKSGLTDYPSELPDGAVRVAWSPSENKFINATAANYGNGLNVASLDQYVYPANLYYWVNSSLRTSITKQSANYGEKNWSAVLNDLYEGPTAVGVNTHSVAIVSPLQYGVARLNSKVNALNANTYYDNDGNPVDVTLGFTLTGILIGNQKSVGWNFEVKGDDDYTIYDKTLASDGTWTVLPPAGSETVGTATSTNYTLALQTIAGTSVYVALEFVNNGNEFKGADGMIPSGGKFYLVAQLDPTVVTSYSSGTLGKDRVFTQDFKTIANFTIKNGTASGGEVGLGAATNGLPDLRSPERELGLSVNLEWQEGLTFQKEI